MTLFVQISRNKNFNTNILPKIDALAEEQGKNRSDVIRDILYARFGYEPEPRSQDNINEDLIKERQEEEKVKCRCIIVRVDGGLSSKIPVSYTHLRAHETPEHLVCRLLL